MPLQNRVDPFGELFSTPARGLFMGNRGGRIHNDAQELLRRRWASRQWICCVLDFKSRARDVWGRYYTELFFLDEVTALAAGHRPCFECRRADATAFATCWREAFALRCGPRAPEMDDVLHAERLDRRSKRTHRCVINDLPDGTMMALDGCAHAIRGDSLLRWTPHGYEGHQRRPRGTTVEVLTPPAIVAVLKAGYAPHWHPTATQPEIAL